MARGRICVPILTAVLWTALALSGCVATPGTPNTGPTATIDSPNPEPLARTWANPEDAIIRPGIPLADGSCTTNFLFTTPDNRTVYIGTAAHCLMRGEPDPDACGGKSVPLGSEVQLAGLERPATLAYSSWITMQAVNETSPFACPRNDLALLQLNESDAVRASPAVLHFGGPTGLAKLASIDRGDKALAYGNSGLRPQDSALSPRQGIVSNKPPAENWTLEVHFVTPGVVGDSGGPVMAGDGLALGQIVSIGERGSNGVSVLATQLEYARIHAGFEVRLATWELLDDGIAAISLS